MSFATSPPPLLTDVVRLVTSRMGESPVEQGVQEQARATTRVFGVELGTLMTVVAAFALGWLVVWGLFRLAGMILVRRAELRRQVARLSVPLGLAGGFLAARLGLAVMARHETWYRMTAFVLMAGLVAAAAWGAWRIVDLVEDRILSRYREAGVNDRRERRIRTQTMLLRRILNAVIVVIAVAVVLISIPEVRSLGAGLLASAGLISVIAGLAVQSTLTNVIAGVQLAFTDSIRVGDVVDMEKVFGTVEEITLSNVVVKLWDGRRMVYPSSHFTTKPFENWTRVGSAVAGVVEMDVDWRVPMDALRERLTALLESTDLWDRRENSMQVIDAVGGHVRIRAVVSARNSGELWDLRCLVREDFVAFLRQEYPEGIVTQRLSDGPALISAAHARHHDDGAVASEAGAPDGAGSRPAEPTRSPRPTTAPLPTTGTPSADVRPATRPGARVHTAPLTQVDEHSSMYTGSITAVQRNRELDGPGEDAFAERRAQRDAREGAARAADDLSAEERGRAGAHAARPDQPGIDD